MGEDEFKGSHTPVEKQVCQVKSVSGENLSDKGISLFSFSAEELTEAQKHMEIWITRESTWLVRQFLPQRRFLDVIRKSNVTTWNVTVSG